MTTVLERMGWIFFAIAACIAAAAMVEWASYRIGDWLDALARRRLGRK